MSPRDQKRSHTGAKFTTERVTQLETLEAIADLRLLPHHIRHRVDELCILGVLSSCCLVFMMIEQSHVLDVEHHNIAPPSVDLWLIRRARFVPLKETSMIVTVC